MKIPTVALVGRPNVGKSTIFNKLVGEKISIIEDTPGVTRDRIYSDATYKDFKFNVIDTGGIDGANEKFNGNIKMQAEIAIDESDVVLFVVDGKDGLTSNDLLVRDMLRSSGKRVIVVINKIDRPGARPEKVVDEVIELFIELDATDEQLDFPVVYASAKQGISKLNMSDEDSDMTPLFETIINTIDAPACDEEGPAQMLVSNIDYDEYVGRIAVGRVERGELKVGMNVAICKAEDKVEQGKIAKIYTHVGLKKVEVESAKAGDIIELAGLADISIGDTICDPEHIEKIPFVNIDEPTVSMTFSVNNGPLAGREGQFVTSRHIRDRLFKELERNVSLRVKEGETPDSFEVSGRGELHLAVLIETMRREGFELLVSRPKVIIKEIDGVKCEPVEDLVVNVPDESVGTVIEKLGRRKGEMVNMETAELGHTKIEFNIPARGIIGYRTEFLTDTKGEGTMATMFKGYEPFKGEVVSRVRGTIVAFEAGKSITYGLYNADRKSVV